MKNIIKAIGSGLIVLVAALLVGAASTALAGTTVCPVFSGCTGTGSIPSQGQVLVGQSNGTYAPQATSTLGISVPVTSVFGRTGGITAQTGDYSAGQITGLGTLATLNSVNNSNWSGTALTIGNGGTGITSPPALNQFLVGNGSGGYTYASTGSFGSGTVTSVALTAPTALTVSGSPITTSGTLGLSLTSGYVIPLTASTTDWQTAFTSRISSATSPLQILSNVLSVASGYNIPLTASTTQWSNLYAASTTLPYVTSVAATSSSGLTFSGSPITSSGTLTLAGVLKAANGGTGTSTTPALGQVLVGQSNGTYAPQATSTLGLTPIVLSVFGRTGNITAQSGDYSAGQITGLGSLALLSSINNSNWSGTPLSPMNGGTGTTSPPTLGQVLVGNGAGGYNYVATSTFGGAGSSTQWVTNGSKIYYNGGNVGVGTTSPSALFQIFSASGTSTISLDTGTSTHGSCIEMKDYVGGGYTYIYTQAGILFSSNVSCK